jgi:hypothetical protein
VPCMASGHHQQQVKLKLINRSLSERHVANMGRVKGPAKDPDARGSGGWTTGNAGNSHTQSRRTK